MRYMEMLLFTLIIITITSTVKKQLSCHSFFIVEKLILWHENQSGALINFKNYFHDYSL